jgi:hypothetical protein
MDPEPTVLTKVSTRKGGDVLLPPWTCLHASGELVVSQPTIMGC